MIFSYHCVHLLLICWHSIILETRQTKAPFLWDLNKSSTENEQLENSHKASQEDSQQLSHQIIARDKSTIPVYGRKRKYKTRTDSISPLYESGECNFHRPRCPHWSQLTQKQKRANKTRWYLYTLVS